MLDRLAAFFTPPRIAFALAAVVVIIILVNTIDSITDRPPHWKQLKAEGDAGVEQGQDELAEERYRLALEVSTGSDESNPVDISSIMDSLASISRRAGNPAEAQRLLRQSLALKQSGGLEETWSAAWVLEQLGNLEKRSGNTLASETLYRRADAIRETLAGKSPDDESLQRYRRNVALIRLVPQTGYRSPETPHFPLIELDEQTTHAEFRIVLRRNRDLAAQYLPTLTTPSRQVFPLPDTLSVDPLHPAERTLRLTLSERFFDEGKGTYRIGIRALTGRGTAPEDVYFFQVPADPH